MKNYLLLGLLISFSAYATPPKVTVVIIVDQFSAHFIPMLKPFLTGGIRYLVDNGTSYANALYDHNAPGTAPGHTMLSTGTYASYHGIVNNYWFDKNGKKVKCDDGPVETSAVFAPNGLYPFGKSPRNILVDTLSDQMMLHSYPHACNSVWSLSLKSRAAISTAGRLGKAIWFDKRSGNFTSSKAYFNTLPAWLTTFNQKLNLPRIQHLTWKPFFDPAGPAYRFPQIGNYRYSILKYPLFNRTFALEFNESKKALFGKTPTANQALIDLAYHCIEQNYSHKASDRLFMWLSLSSFDKAGHAYGPQSYEMVDLVYHIDAQLKEFIDKVYTLVDPEDVLFVLTADHGAQPIPEIAAEQGMTLARRLIYPDIVSHINRIIEEKYCIKKSVTHFKEPQFYLDQSLLKELSPDMRQRVYTEIKQFLLSLPGIRHAWTFDELLNTVFQEYDLDRYIQRQLYKGRSGQIFYSVSPYTLLDSYYPEGRRGTSHITGFGFDTHVPLIFHQRGTFEQKTIYENVFIPQVPVTLATLFEVPRPSAATADVLPHFFKEHE